MTRPGLALALAALSLAAAPLRGQEAPAIPSHPRLLRLADPVFRLPPADDHRVVLPGGAVLFHFEDTTLPLVDVAAAWRGGSFLDPPGAAGLALLTGSQMRRGGTRDLAPDALDARLDELGIRLDTRFGELRGGASLSAMRWVLDDALALLFDVLARPRFDAERLAHAVGQLETGMARRNDDPLDVLEREWQWLLYGHEHFSTRPPTPSSIRALTPADLAALYRRVVDPSRLVLAVSGDVGREELLERLTRLFAGWRGAGEPAPPWPPPAPAHEAEPGLYVVDFDTPQTKVLMGHRALPASDERGRIALDVAVEILGGGGAISRIAGRLRTAEGLVYRASAAYDADDPWPRDFRIFFDAEAGAVPRAVGMVRAEIDRMREQLVHPKELEVARRTLRSALRLSFDTAEELAGYYAEDELLARDSAAWERRFEMLGTITAEEVRAAARRHFEPERLLTLVVGRAGELIGALEAAGSQPVRLPARDPLTLEPIASGAEEPPDPAGD